MGGKDPMESRSGALSMQTSCRAHTSRYRFMKDQIRSLVCNDFDRDVQSVVTVVKELIMNTSSLGRGSYVVTVGIDIPEEMEDEYHEWMRVQVGRFSVHGTF